MFFSNLLWKFVCWQNYLEFRHFTLLTLVFSNISGAKPVFIIYVLEVSQKNHRGMFISLYLIFGSFGFACSFALQYFFKLKILAAISIFIAVAGFCGTSLLPDTKYWYLMNNQIDKAKDSSSWYVFFLRLFFKSIS